MENNRYFLNSEDLEIKNEIIEKLIDILKNKSIEKQDIIIYIDNLKYEYSSSFFNQYFLSDILVLLFLYERTDVLCYLVNYNDLYKNINRFIYKDEPILFYFYKKSKHEKKYIKHLEYLLKNINDIDYLQKDFKNNVFILCVSELIKLNHLEEIIEKNNEILNFLKNELNNDKTTIIHQIINNENINLLKVIIKHFGGKIFHFKDDFNKTPLHILPYKKEISKEIFKIITSYLENKINYLFNVMNIKDKYTGLNVVGTCVMCSNLDLLKEIRNFFGTYPFKKLCEEKDNFGRDVLLLSYIQDNKLIYDFLLENGCFKSADLFEKDE